MTTVIIVIAIILIPLAFLRFRLGPPREPLTVFGRGAAYVGYWLTRAPQPSRPRRQLLTDRAEAKVIAAILEEL